MSKVDQTPNFVGIEFCEVDEETAQAAGKNGKEVGTSVDGNSASNEDGERHPRRRRNLIILGIAVAIVVILIIAIRAIALGVALGTRPSSEAGASDTTDLSLAEDTIEDALDSRDPQDTGEPGYGVPGLEDVEAPEADPEDTQGLEDVDSASVCPYPGKLCADGSCAKDPYDSDCCPEDRCANGKCPESALSCCDEDLCDYEAKYYGFCPEKKCGCETYCQLTKTCIPRTEECCIRVCADGRCVKDRQNRDCCEEERCNLEHSFYGFCPDPWHCGCKQQCPHTRECIPRDEECFCQTGKKICADGSCLERPKGCDEDGNCQTIYSEDDKICCPEEKCDDGLCPEELCKRDCSKAYCSEVTTCLDKSSLGESLECPCPCNANRCPDGKCPSALDYPPKLGMGEDRCCKCGQSACTNEMEVRECVNGTSCGGGLILKRTKYNLP